MPFRGAMPRPMVALCVEAAKSMPTEVQVGCSGNFGIDRALFKAGKSVSGNDVTIYSCAIGRWLAGEETGIRPRAESEWLLPYCGEPIKDVATVMLVADYMQGSAHNRYYDRVRGEFARQLPDLHKRTVANLQDAKFALRAFHAGDVLDLECDTFVSFPPYFAGDYEAMWKTLDRHFEWDPPDYALFDDDSKRRLIEQCLDRRHWILGFNEGFQDDRLDEFLVGRIRSSFLTVPVKAYSNIPVARISHKVRKYEYTKTPLATPELLFDAKTLTADEFPVLAFDAQRSKQLAWWITASYPVVSIRLCLDGHHFGFMGFQFHMDGSKKNMPLGVPVDRAYMLSDFPISGIHPRLSELVVMAATSNEVREILEQSAGRRVGGVLTTAFSDRPVSMKYRGHFDLITRLEAGDINPKKWKLQYWSPFRGRTLAESLAEWRRKHGH